MATLEEMRLEVVQEIEINAPIETTWEAVLWQAGPGFNDGSGKTQSAKLEPWPGGRWYRDLGNNTGHWWGHVQVIKPPALLELCGPMFMSYPVASHIAYRLTAKGDGTVLKLTHRAFGEIAKEHREGVSMGWKKIVEEIKKRATT